MDSNKFKQIKYSRRAMDFVVFTSEMVELKNDFSVSAYCDLFLGSGEGAEIEVPCVFPIVRAIGEYKDLQDVTLEIKGGQVVHKVHEVDEEGMAVKEWLIHPKDKGQAKLYAEEEAILSWTQPEDNSYLLTDFGGQSLLVEDSVLGLVSEMFTEEQERLVQENRDIIQKLKDSTEEEMVALLTLLRQNHEKITNGGSHGH